MRGNPLVEGIEIGSRGVLDDLIAVLVLHRHDDELVEVV
jgi:hypothetical protein